MGFILCLFYILIVMALSRILFELALKLHDCWERRKCKFNGFKDIHFRVTHKDGLYSFDVNFTHTDACMLACSQPVSPLFNKHGPFLPVISLSAKLIPIDPMDKRQPTSMGLVIFQPRAGSYSKLTMTGINYNMGETCPEPTITVDELDEMAQPVVTLVREQLKECVTAQGYRKVKALL